MSIELRTKYAPKAQEVFKAESKTGLITNTDYDWTGAHTVAIYKVTTAALSDYQRNYTGAESETEQISRYGTLKDLSATVQECVLSKDRSFIFNVDMLDADESSVEVESALARQLREVVNPERDKYIYSKMCTGAGIKPDAIAAVTYDTILKATALMDEAEVPDTGRVLVINPNGYAALKKELQSPAYNTLSAEERASGVIGYLDGMPVVKVPSSYLPANFGFMIAHPSACVAPVKLADYSTHEDTPLASGTIVTGRIVYDAFVLDNKKTGICYQALTPPKNA